MNNEPVAWINEPYAIEAGFDNGDGTYCVLIKRLPLRTETHKDWKPHEKLLYTHPVKELTDDVTKYHYNKGHEDGRKLVAVKELTNEEMRKVINEIVDKVTVSEMVTFLTISKAILRKASEK